MHRILKFVVYFLMIIVGLVAMYAILNAGNPGSLLREYIPNPQHDVYVAFVSSAFVFVLGFIVFYSRDREGFQQIIQMNEKEIRSQRKKGKTDDEIAESILAAMGSSSGYKHNMAKRKLVAYLSNFS